MTNEELMTREEAEKALDDIISRAEKRFAGLRSYHCHEYGVGWNAIVNALYCDPDCRSPARAHHDIGRKLVLVGQLEELHAGALAETSELLMRANAAISKANAWLESE